MLSKSAQLKYILNGVSDRAPIEWEDIEVEATFDSGVQPNITTSEFKFPNEAAEQIRQYIKDGNIFEGFPLLIQAVNKDIKITPFKGFLDLTDDYEDLLSKPIVKAKIRKDNGLNTLNSRLSSLTYGYLEKIGVFSQLDYVDVDYKVVPKTSPLEFLIISITLYILIKETIELIKRLLDTVAIAAGDLAGGLIGPLGAVAYLILAVAAELVYLVVIIKAIVALVRQLLRILNPPTRQHKAMTQRTALTNVANYLGYTLISPIEELDFVHFIPSNQNLDEQDERTGLFSKLRGTSSGIPNSTDYGYKCSEMFSDILNTYNARLVIIGQELHLRWEGDPFWIKTSTFDYKSKNPLLETQRNNTKELFADYVIEFDTDINNHYTVDQYKGTAYEVKTDLAIPVQIKNANYLSGQKSIKINAQLGARKDKLNIIENILLVLATAADFILNSMNKLTPSSSPSNLAQTIRNKVGLLKVSQNDTSKPMLVYLVNGRLPANHRDLWSAKVLWDKYHSFNSFVDHNYNGQKFVYKNITIPFGMEDFIALTNNAYFLNFEGEVSKATSIKWRMGSDTAVMDFWTRKPYTKNLKETKIEAE